MCIKQINKINHLEGRIPRDRRFLPKSHEECDKDEPFTIKLLYEILYELGWIADPSDIKALREIKARFYVEKPRGR